MSAPRSRVSPGVGLAIGVGAAVLFGALGAFGWLAWVWSRTPLEVRQRVSRARRGAVVAIGVGGIAANVAGFAMTILALTRAFADVNGVAAEDKARRLGEGISEAMSWTAAGALAAIVAGAVALVTGFVLLRSAREVTSRASS